MTRRDHPLLGRWLAAMLLAEAVGFAAAMGLGRGVVALVGEPGDALTVGLSALAGAVEGASLGLGQSLVLRRLPGAPRPRAWIAASALGGALAWALGMTAGTHGPQTMPAPAIVALVLVVSGLVLGGVLGGAQAWTLRARPGLAARWLVASAVGWLIGLLFCYAGIALTTASTPTPRSALIFALSGAAMALAPALATGLQLRRFAPDADPRRSGILRP